MAYHLEGQRFGHLTVIRRDGSNKWKEILWLCKCDCGNVTHVTSRNLRTGRIKSCGKPQDFTGQTFGELYVIGLDHIDTKRRRYFKCKCSCGKETVVSGSSLKAGTTTSCGHVWLEAIHSKGTHGLSNDPIYSCWEDMVHRVTHKADRNYKHYTENINGKLIEDEWIKNPQAFMDYIGPRPSKEYSIDRIDPNKGYIKGNVRWADSETQSLNQAWRYKGRIIGIYQQGNNNFWYARLTYKRKTHYKGPFANKAEAMRARWKMEEKFNFPHTYEYLEIDNLAAKSI